MLGIGLRFAVWLFTLMLLLSTVWALWEVGLDRQRLMPRLFVWFLVGLVLVLPVARQALKPSRQRVSVSSLIIALILAGITLDPLGQLKYFTHHTQEIVATLVPGMELPWVSFAEAQAGFRQPEG